MFTGLDWVSNFEKNRWFLVLRVKAPDNNELNKLLHISNTVVQEYDQPPLYVEPTPKSSPKQKRPRFDVRGKYGTIYFETDTNFNFHSFSRCQERMAPDARSL